MRKFLIAFAVFFLCGNIGFAKPSSYSSGSKGYSSVSRQSGKSSYSSSKPTNSSSKINYKGNSYSSTKKYTPVNPSNSLKPKNGVFDGDAAQAKAREESKQKYIKGPTAKKSYTTPKGKEIEINHNSKSVEQIRNMDHKTYVTREVRIHNTYSSYYGRPPVTFNDSYNTFFWYWLLDRSLDERANWAYHHRLEMDEARYKELLSKDAKLESKIKQLEQEKLTIDPNYVPTGIDPDLQYNDEYVDSVYNPHLENSDFSGVVKVFVWIFVILAIGIVAWVLIWLIFIKNW